MNITRRTRSLGFSWTNSVEQTSHGLRVANPPRTPEVTGTVRQVVEEYNRARCNNQGNDWRYQWFLAGKPLNPDNYGGLYVLTQELLALANGQEAYVKA